MKQLWPVLRSYLMITLGASLYAFAFSLFCIPNDIAYGGVTGIAQLINYLFPACSVGSMMILINLPMFLIAWRMLGRSLMIGSLYTMFLSSILVDFFNAFCQFAPMKEVTPAALFGGLLMGIGAGLVFRENATFGGADIIVLLIKRKVPYLSTGQLVLWFNLIIVACVSLAFGKLSSALFGAISLFLVGRVMDWVLYGADPTKVAYIISDRSEQIARSILDEMHRGVTLLEGRGAWTRQEKQVVLCAFRNHQILFLKRRVKEIDPAAFVIVCEAYEVLGGGFVPPP